MIPPTPTDEQEPGVYVRSKRPERELDFLWDKERKKTEEPDRFHLGFFAAGALVGSLVTLGICLVFFGKTLSPAPEKAVVVDSAAIPTEEETLPMVLPNTTEKTEDRGFHLPFFGSKAQEKPQDIQPAEPAAPKEENSFGLSIFSSRAKEKPATEAFPPAQEPQYYEVQSGDSLGSIAIQFYDSSSPKVIARIVKANALSSPDDIRIGQQLIIPPEPNEPSPQGQ